MNFNLWIDKNDNVLDKIINSILYYLNTHKNLLLIFKAPKIKIKQNKGFQLPQHHLN